MPFSSRAELSAKSIAEFQRLWRESYDEELSEERARDYAEHVLAYVALVLTEDEA